MSRLLAMLVVSLGALAAVEGATLIPPANLTASASGTVSNPLSGREAKVAVNGAGLSDVDLDGIGETHAASEFGDNISWLSNSGGKTGWFVVDLGAVYPLDHIKFWNFNSAQNKSRGVAAGDWYISTQANPPGRTFAGDPDWSLLIDDASFAIAPGTSDYDDPAVFDMGGAWARWVALDITANHGHGLFVGISEMQFLHGEIPEPLTVTALLAGLGLAGGYVRRRRSA